MQGLIALARSQGATGNATRGACKICGGLGHLTKKCKNGVSGHTADIGDLDAAAAGGCPRGRGRGRPWGAYEQAVFNSTRSCNSSESAKACGTVRKAVEPFPSPGDASVADRRHSNSHLLDNGCRFAQAPNSRHPAA